MTLGAPDASTLLAAVQGVTYVAVLLTAGLAVFLATMLPADESLRPLRRRISVLITDGAAVGSLAALLLVPVTKAYQADTGLPAAFSNLGRADLASNEFLVAAVVTGAGVVIAVLLRAELLGRHARAVVVASAAGAAASMALVGHTRTFGPAGLVWTADVVHLLAAAVWFGGLVGLVISLPRLLDREGAAAEAVTRFSAVAAASLVALVVAGVLLTWRILGSWQALLNSAYGNVLLLKVGVAALVVVAAAWNRFKLVPALGDAAGPTQRVPPAGPVRRVLAFEAGGLVAVLLVTGFLVQQMPSMPARMHGSGQELSETVDDVTVRARLDQDLRGRTTLHLRLEDSSGTPFRTYENPSVRAIAQGTEVGPVPALSQSEGRYAAALQIPFADRWTVQVSLRLDEVTERDVSFDLDVS